MDDEAIIGLFWQRDQSAVGAAAERYGGLCRRVAVNILRDVGDADECVNDALLRAWQAIPPARPQRLSAFLGKITRNLALNRLERRSAARRGGGAIDAALSELEHCLPDGAADEDDIVDSEVITKTVDAFLAATSPGHRLIFVRRYWYFDSVETIAEGCGMTESGVKSLLSRLRKRLKKCLEKEGIII